MIDKVLVPVDGSEASDRILAFTRPVFRTGTKVVILRVLALDDPLEPARDHVEALARALGSVGIRAEARLLVGDPAEEIEGFAREYQPDLVVLATHARTGLSRWLHGSVAEHVLRHTSSPVLVTNPSALEASPELRVNRIVVPLDGSERSAEILPLAASVARTHGAELILTHAIELVVLEDPFVSVTAVKTTEEAQTLLANYTSRVEGVPVRLRTAFGSPAATILSIAAEEKADLIALTTHGRTGLPRVVYGSVAEQLLRHGPLPLLVRRTAVPG